MVSSFRAVSVCFRCDIHIHSELTRTPSLFHRRWEVFHGHNSELTKWESKSQNPRRPSRYTFENFRFIKMPRIAGCDKLSDAIADFELGVMASAERMLAPQPFADVPVRTTQNKDNAVSATINEDNANERGQVVQNTTVSGVIDGTTLSSRNERNESRKMENDIKSLGRSSSMVTEMKQTNKESDKDSRKVLIASQDQVDTYSLAAHFLSPACSGVYDELLAFIKQGVLHASTDGIPYLGPEWASKVDVIVLDDMDSAWGTEMDPDGRYCVHFELRDTLEELWIRTDFGWSLAEDPDDIIFDFEVLKEWKEAFEGRIEEKAHRVEGIGRFGL